MAREHFNLGKLRHARSLAASTPRRKRVGLMAHLIHPAIGQNNVAGRQLEALFQALDEEGFEVLGAEHLEEGRLIDKLGAIVIDEFHYVGDSHRGWILEILGTLQTALWIESE